MKIKSQRRHRKRLQQNREYREEQSGNFRTEKNAITQIVKYWVVGFNSRMEGTEEKIHETEDKTIEMTYSEQRRENRLEKK